MGNRRVGMLSDRSVHIKRPTLQDCDEYLAATEHSRSRRLSFRTDHTKVLLRWMQDYNPVAWPWGLSSTHSSSWIRHRIPRDLQGAVRLTSFATIIRAMYLTRGIANSHRCMSA